MRKLILALILLLMSISCNYRPEASVKQIVGEPNKNSIISFVIHVEVYDVDVVILITESIPDAVGFVSTMMQDTTVNYRDFLVKGVVFSDSQHPSVMWIPYVEDNQGTINHELFHLTANTMGYVGIPLSETSEEGYAYLMGYLTRMFYENLKIIKNQENEQVN